MADVPTHGPYDELRKNWEYAWEVYTGDYADEQKISRYLKQRQQGEHNLNYEERKSEALADPALDYGLVIDSLNGLQFTAEPKSSRTWAETNDEGQPVRNVSLGAPDDDGGVDGEPSAAYRLKRSVDGEGTNLTAFLKQVGVRLKTKQWVWGAVDGAIMDGDTVVRPPVAKMVDPEDVINWRSENGRLVEVLTTTTVDTRSSIEDPYADNQKEAYLKYDLEGWAIVDEDFDELDVPGRTSAEYAYYASPRQEQRILPIFRQKLPLPRRVGYLMARKCIALFNKESELDNYGRLICIPRMSLAAEHAQENAEELAKGSVLTHPKESENMYLEPSSGPFAALDQRLERKRQAFMVQSFREYGNAAQEQTATEKQQDWAAGVAAYLTLEAGALQDFEQQLMWRMEQAIFGDTPDAWGQYDIDRSTDFEPEDIKDQLETVIKRAFGAKMPIDVDTATQLVTGYLEEHGLDPDPDDIRDEIEEQGAQQAQAAATTGGPLLG